MTMPEAETSLWRGVVLAGGRSSRMGRDKAFLEWRGRTFLETAVDSLEAVVGKGKVIVSGKGKGELSVEDHMADLGPIGGIATVSKAMPDDAMVLVVPVDMPLLRAEPLSVLKDLSNRGFRESDRRSFFFQDHELPFTFRLGAEARSRLNSLCDPSADPRSRSIAAFLKAMNAQPIPVPAQLLSSFPNLNTKDDWESLKSHEDPL